MKPLLLALLLQVARVGVNEGGFQNRWESALVWQTTLAWGPTPEKRLQWLQRHSARVAGDKPCLGGNCRWTPELDWAGSRPSALEVPEDFWALRLRPLWLDTLRLVIALERGDYRGRPCDVQPITWGSAEDRPRAIHRGLYPIGCRGPTQNDGFTWARGCYRDGAWVCDPRFEPVIASELP